MCQDAAVALRTRPRTIAANSAWVVGLLLAVIGGILLSSGEYSGHYLIAAAIPIGVGGGVMRRKRRPGA